MSPRTARSCWVTGPCSAELRDEVLSEPTVDQVLVQACFSGVSRGTESLVYRHAVPESEYERMRSPFQSGTLPGPVKYGYSSVGRVAQGPPALQGRSVFCLYPHQSAYVVPAHSVLPLPDGVPEARAVLAANMETALNALWDAAPLLGQRIVVVGAGVVGSLVGYLAARIPGCEVRLLDVDKDRASIAAALGCHFALVQGAAGGADLVVHASGTAAGLRSALALARDEGVILELSWFGDREVTLPLGEAFHARRLTLRSSQVGRVGGAMRGRYTTTERLAMALELLRDPALDVLISGESPLEALPTLLADLTAPGGRALCHRIRY